ncbi:Periphilin-1 [Myotis davidii]|uniref:Periphilin-1 n=1 Tax=Myotis davidii TaxID=225400 RepID=L5MDJ7_MYODS|nr:Periphilin-1 [Myotis davidii]
MLHIPVILGYRPRCKPLRSPPRLRPAPPPCCLANIILNGQKLHKCFPKDHASSNELICTRSLVKNCIVLIDRTMYPLCTAPGPQKGGQADFGGGRAFKQKSTKENSEDLIKGERMPKSAVFSRSSFSRANFWHALLQDQAMAHRRDEMWSEGRHDYERLPRERAPPRNHPSDGYHRVVNIVTKRPPLLDRPGEGGYSRYYSHVDYRDYDEGRSFSHGRRSGPPHRGDESNYKWTRDDHSGSRQPEYRDMRDGFRRKSFHASHYGRDRSPHKRENPFLRESPVGRKDSPHSRSGSSVSSRSYSPERSKTYSFHQSQHRKPVRAAASYKRQNEGKPARDKERPVQSLKTSRDTSPSSSSTVPSSKVMLKLVFTAALAHLDHNQVAVNVQ